MVSFRIYDGAGKAIFGEEAYIEQLPLPFGCPDMTMAIEQSLVRLARYGPSQAVFEMLLGGTWQVVVFCPWCGDVMKVVIAPPPAAREVKGEA
jgi:hypothetical protein